MFITTATFLISEEAEQLSTKDGVVRLPGPDRGLRFPLLILVLPLKESTNVYWGQ